MEKTAVTITNGVAERSIGGESIQTIVGFIVFDTALSSCRQV